MERIYIILRNDTRGIRAVGYAPTFAEASEIQDKLNELEPREQGTITRTGPKYLLDQLPRLSLKDMEP